MLQVSVVVLGAVTRYGASQESNSGNILMFKRPLQADTAQGSVRLDRNGEAILERVTCFFERNNTFRM